MSRSECSFGPAKAAPPGLPEIAALLNVGDLARMLDCSPRHVYRMCDAGKMPKPLRLGALVRWDRNVIETWISDGCPSVRAGRGERE